MGLNLLFVVAFKMGVAGVGIATVIANGVSGSLVCCFLMQEKGSMHLSVKAMQLDKKYTERSIAGRNTGRYTGNVFFSCKCVYTICCQLLWGGRKCRLFHCFNV